MLKASYINYALGLMQTAVLRLPVRLVYFCVTFVICVILCLIFCMHL
jgi:hypothetical protein